MGPVGGMPMGKARRSSFFRLGRGRTGWSGLPLTLPVLVVVLAVVAYPIAWAARISLWSSAGVRGAGQYVGLANYEAVLRSGSFQEALANTIGFVILAVGLELLLGLGIALVLHMALPGSAVFRVIFALPLLVAPLVSALNLQFIFNDQYGVVAYLLRNVGIEPPLWFASVWGARASIIIADIWLTLPFVILVLLAGLSGLPKELTEAARTDGAGAMALLRHITLPLLRPTILLILVIRVADAFRVFDTVYVLTEGGPGDKTNVLSLYIYRQAFDNLEFGRASAASFLTMFLILVVTLVLMWLLRRGRAAV